MAAAIVQNNSLTKLNLKGNCFTPKGIAYILQAIKDKSHFQLDINRNNLREEEVQALLDSSFAPTGRISITYGAEFFSRDKVREFNSASLTLSL